MAARRIIALLICLCLFLMPCSAQAVSTSDAAELIDTARNCTLTLTYTCNGTAFANVPVKVYRVADVSAKAQYTLLSSFAGSGLRLNGISSAGEWDLVRSTLESHILANAIGADVTAVTDAAGQVRLEALKPGLYLVTSGHVVQDGQRGSFAPALIALPGLDGNGLWQYQITVAPKPEVTPPSRPDDPIQFQVLKLWKDESSRADRPQSIEVEIFREGVSHETVTLLEANHWSCTWTAEDDGADWMVVERNIPAGYTATVEERTTTFLLTNTRLPDEPPPEDPPSENPPMEEPSEELPFAPPPKTGDTPHILLYTVLMYVSGAVLILLGITGKKKRV